MSDVMVGSVMLVVPVLTLVAAVVAAYQSRRARTETCDRCAHSYQEILTRLNPLGTLQVHGTTYRRKRQAAKRKPTQPARKRRRTS